MQTLGWDIEGILAAHPGLYLEHHVVMAVALMSQLSESPCEFPGNSMVISHPSGMRKWRVLTLQR